MLGAAVSVPLVAAAWAVIRAVRPSVSDAPTPGHIETEPEAKAKAT